MVAKIDGGAWGQNLNSISLFLWSDLKMTAKNCLHRVQNRTISPPHRILILLGKCQRKLRRSIIKIDFGGVRKFTLGPRQSIVWSARNLTAFFASAKNAVRCALWCMYSMRKVSDSIQTPLHVRTHAMYAVRVYLTGTRS